MDKIHIIEIDSEFDLRIKEFQKKLNENEHIVSQTTAGTKLIIVTRETKKERRNLLLEEHSK